MGKVRSRRKPGSDVAVVGRGDAVLYKNKKRGLGVDTDIGVDTKNEAEESLSELRKKQKDVNDKLLMLFRMSTRLQESLDIEENLENAVDTFRSLGYDRVRIYLLEGEVLSGAKSSHMKDSEFKKLSFSVREAQKKDRICISSGKPAIEKTNKITKIGKLLGKTGMFESASLPLMSRNRCRGIISLDNMYSRKPIEEEDLNLLMTFANQVAVALENAVFYKKNLRQLNELRALYDISSTITSTLDLEKIISMIVIKIVRLLSVDICTIMLLDDTKKVLNPCAYFDVKGHTRMAEEPLEVKKSLTGTAIMTKKVVYSEDLLSDDRFKNKRYARRENLVSVISVPMYIEGRPIGAINLYTRKKRTFSEEEKELLNGLSNHAAMIIKNSQLYGRIKMDKGHLSDLVEISKAINSTLDEYELLEEVLDRTVRFTSADYGFVLLVKKGNLEVEICKNIAKEELKRLKFRMGDKPAWQTARLKKPAVTGDFTKGRKHIQVSRESKSAALIPLIYKDEVIGIINLESLKTDSFRYFRKSLDILTNHIAAALENIKLYEEVKNFNTHLKDEIGLATQELREKNIELEKLDMLKSEFVSNVSHELRTPLTSISGYTKLLLMKKLGKLNHKQEQSLAIISDEADRLTRLIGDVLDLSKLEAGRSEVKLEEFDMVELAQESIETLSVNAQEKRINIKVDALEGKVIILGGRDLIKQVYINLISNALKFTGQRGKIEVRIRKKKSVVEVSVNDTGKGIPKEYIPKLFNKFVQVDSSMTKEHGGTGLGLVIVKHILNLHKGTISVESEVGKGSTFTFFIPLRQKEDKNQTAGD